MTIVDAGIQSTQNDDRFSRMLRLWLKAGRAKSFALHFKRFNHSGAVMATWKKVRGGELVESSDDTKNAHGDFHPSGVCQALTHADR